MTVRDSFGTVNNGDVLEDGWFNGSYNQESNNRWVLINSGNIPTGSQTATIQSGISSDYVAFKLILQDVTLNNQAIVYLRINSNTTGYKSSYHYVIGNTSSSDTPQSNEGGYITKGIYLVYVQATGTSLFDADININNHSSSWKPHFNGFAQANGYNILSNFYGTYDSTVKISSIEIFSDGENVTGGKFLLYGLKTTSL